MGPFGGDERGHCPGATAGVVAGQGPEPELGWGWGASREPEREPGLGLGRGAGLGREPELGQEWALSRGPEREPVPALEVGLGMGARVGSWRRGGLGARVEGRRRRWGRRRAELGPGRGRRCGDGRW
ncbi:hypothetical protein GCM10010171_60660 [Actinokineospora fastidiosa]|uniref:Uncharacterized protein n=1 Tax=Actinokineospora fastidiosa TaxID=1816 RepID=A0A918LJK8_9PSEU|nr:hypothetical protein GCM10010171_60660 [Actinokineospora fastidiosa]